MKNTLLWMVLFAFVAGGCITERRVVSRSPVNMEKGLELDLGDSQEEQEGKLIEEFKKEPNSAKAAWRAGWYYFKNKKYTLAESWFRQSISLIKDLDSYRGAFFFYYYLGEACLWQGKIQPAFEYFEKTVKVKQPIPPLYIEYKEYRQAHWHLAVLYRYKNDKKKSDQHFAKYIELGGSRERVALQKERIEVTKKYSQ